MKKVSSKRPWGGFKQFTLNEKSTVKILSIGAGKRFSLQHHKKRREFWKFLDNPAIVTIGNRKRRVKGGDEIMIGLGKNHRIQALGKEVNVLEISLGNFDEKDIVRVEDDFGRS